MIYARTLIKTRYFHTSNLSRMECRKIGSMPTTSKLFGFTSTISACLRRITENSQHSHYPLLDVAIDFVQHGFFSPMKKSFFGLYICYVSRQPEKCVVAWTLLLLWVKPMRFFCMLLAGSMCADFFLVVLSLAELLYSFAGSFCSYTNICVIFNSPNNLSYIQSDFWHTALSVCRCECAAY